MTVKLHTMLFLYYTILSYPILYYSILYYNRKASFDLGASEKVQL